MAKEKPTPTARVSLRDVARVVGVSHVTVSLALRGDARVSVARRTEVTAVAQRLGYRPDPMLASLSAYRQSKRPVTIRSTIAWLNQWRDPRALRKFGEFAAYWNGAAAAAEKLGYRLEEFALGKDLSGPRLGKILFTRNVRGLLIPPHRDGLVLPDFDWSPFSIVRLGLSVPHPRAHIVTSDQANCAGMAFGKARELGYRRIGYVSSRHFDLNTGGNFRAGYLGAQDAALPERERLAPLYLQDGLVLKDALQLRRWLNKVKPDAIITTLGHLPPLLAEIGYEVPRDLAVATLSMLDGNFDSGVDQNSEEIGHVALSTLASLIHQNERGIPQYCRRILVEGRWVQGASLPDRAVIAK